MIELYGHRCVALELGGCRGRIEAHHVQYLSQGGRDVPENGIPLCTVHHQAVHSRRVLLRRRWLFGPAADYLARVGWVAWDDDGHPYGRGHRGFAALP